MHWLQSYPTQEGVFYLSPTNSEPFEEAYLNVREQEGRVYPDELVQQLPQLPKSHPQHTEWQYRVWSTEQFFRQTPLTPAHQILDLGCGNGWFTHQLAQRGGAEVVGMDINQVELQQAARLFGSSRCQFAYGDVFKVDWSDLTFDCITLNACVQYFPDLSQLIQTLCAILRPSGEIHFIDSPFYTNATLEAARRRTARYYEDQGNALMQNHYHHHSWEAIQSFNFTVPYHSNSWKARWQRRLLRQGSPFPWIIIQP